MNNKILCVGDSLGMPREGVAFEDTWYFMLAKSFPQFFFISKFSRGLTTNFLTGSSKLDYLERYSPLKIILQVGIVDCSPRYISKESLVIKLLDVLPKFFTYGFWKFIKKYGRRKPENSDVLIEKFEKNLRSYFDRCVEYNIKELILIKIAQPSQNMINRNPGISNQVEKYNLIFERLKNDYDLISIVDPLKFIDNSYFLEDGYHLNVEGNKKIFQHISEHMLVSHGRVTC